MSRDIDAPVLAEFNATQLRPAAFVEVKVAPFGSPAEEYVRMWNGVGPIEWDSTGASPAVAQTWLGAGNLGSISPITETVQIRAEGVKLTLSGIPTEMLSMALEDIVVGYPVKIWFGALSDAGVVLPNPYQSFSGRVDAIHVQLGGQTCSITIECESDLIRLQIPNVRYWTHAEQQREFPGDTGFSRVESLKDVRLNWGSPTGSPVSTASLAMPSVGPAYRNFFP